MKIDVLGIKIDNQTKAQVIAQIQNLVGENRSIFIVTPYSESIVAAQRDLEFRDILNSADISLPDGIGVLWAANFLSSPSPGARLPDRQVGREKGRGRTVVILYQLIKSLMAIVFNPKFIRTPLPEKISGSEFIWDLTQLAANNNYSIFLLGGFGSIPMLVAEKLKQKFTNLKIAGTSSVVIARTPTSGLETKQPQITHELAMTENLINLINQSGADFLFVALGPKTQEKWIYQNLPNLRVKLAIGLGGTFDYLARKRSYRSKFWATIGLEWLFRLLTQPWRAVRIFKGVFGLIWYCISDRIRTLR